MNNSLTGLNEAVEKYGLPLEHKLLIVSLDNLYNTFAEGCSSLGQLYPEYSKFLNQVKVEVHEGLCEAMCEHQIGEYVGEVEVRYMEEQYGS